MKQPTQQLTHARLAAAELPRCQGAPCQAGTHGTGDGLGVVRLPVMKHVRSGALEAVLVQELVVTVLVIFRDRRDNRLASDIPERQR
jgi:hypothetical protein